MTLDKDTLRQEWNSLEKDWYSIYQWDRTAGVGYTEWIAEWIGGSFTGIRLATDGLRKENFKTKAHRGQAELETGIEQFTEKRYLRAIFNLGQLPPLGVIIDYEVPLRAPGTGDAKHGDIDLLCLSSGVILCLEAKHPRSSASILKAILQAFVYTSLTAIRRDKFLDDFKLPKTSTLAPATLIFAAAAAGHQLQQWGNYPHLSALVGMLNTELAKSGVGEIRFFIIENGGSEVLASCLRIDSGKTVVFTNGYTPNIVEWPVPEHRCS
jgi:hypothetical protein